MITTCAIYTRQSKDTNGTGLAVARQQAECEALAAARGWQVCYRESDNDTSASNGRPRPGFDRIMKLAATGAVRVVIVWAVDRLVRRLADLEHVIELCERSGVKLATVSGDLDLSTDQGRLVGRILASVARGEVERKSARQKAAALQAARNGKRYTGCPRPFGYAADHVTVEPAEADAIRWAADCLLGGGSISACMREWAARGLVTAQTGRPFTRTSITTILRNPRLAGLSAYRGEIVGDGQWEAILPLETWRAVESLLADPARKPPRGVRTLLGGLALCRCGNVIQASRSCRGSAVYRCAPQFREPGTGPHVSVRVDQVDPYVTAAVLERLSRPDVAGLLAPPPSAVDTGALRSEAVAIRRNLDELAADRALGVISRSQLQAATGRGNARLAEITAALAESAGGGPLAVFTAGQAAGDIWAGLDLSRRRAVIKALCSITLLPAGRGARSYDTAQKVIITPEKM